MRDRGGFGPRRLLPVVVLAATAAGFDHLRAQPTQPAGLVALRGPATRVRDGDTLELLGHVVRLQGIAAPELHEPLGHEAKLALEALVAGRTLTCLPDGTRSHGRIVAICRVDGEDVGARLVAMGLARDCPRFSAGRYRAIEREAARRGAEIGRRYDLPSYCLTGF
ncbi:MAG: thermonuclease family protein [Geminicoccaceae bacterium]|nr:thermonuclease family protein [Geminicoccaceae bacterium]MCX8099890.1 thermonuclease family protein [Geminicoccaceae bacterium]MDW8368930.1 thermonuclease family protein [Geminicoccaceae bacterium]